MKPKIPMLGHNGGPPLEEPKLNPDFDKDFDEPHEVGGVAGKRLQAFIERIERLEEEKRALAEDIKDVYAELKAVGFDAKTTRAIITLRRKDTEKRREEEELLELYKSAIGMI